MYNKRHFAVAMFCFQSCGDSNTPSAMCRRAWLLGNVTEKAMIYLEQNIESINSPFTLALTSYALQMAGTPMADIAFTKLKNMAEEEGSNNICFFFFFFLP